MKSLLLILVSAFCSLIIFREMWLYVNYRREDPLVNAPRFWRRSVGSLCLLVAMLILFFFDALSAALPSTVARAFMLSAMLILVFIAVLLALRDARESAQAVLREQRLVTARSLAAIGEHVRAERERERANGQAPPETGDGASGAELEEQRRDVNQKEF